MIRKTFSFILVFGFFLNGFSQVKNTEFLWPNKRKIAVSLSYDDALASQLDNALPALNKLNIKASFYILPNSSIVNSRMKEWKLAAENGHELGNHSIYHPCSKSIPGRDWVKKHHDLDRYSIAQIVEEISTANTFLKAIDGKSERTFTPPCFDSKASNQYYLEKVKDYFIAIKGEGLSSGFSTVWSPKGVTGNELIKYIQNIPTKTSLINIVFHGIGDDYLSISTEAHKQLLEFLAKNRNTYYVDSYINIMKYASKNN